MPWSPAIEMKRPRANLLPLTPEPMLAADVGWPEALSAIGSVITPLALAAIGFVVSRQLKRIEAHQWRSQELIAARLRYYREIVEPLNDLFCYFTFIGSWKEMTPPKVVEMKRSLDRTFHTLSAFFDVEVVKAYNGFIDLCFDTFGRWGDDARLRTSGRRRRDSSRVPWQDEWDSMFSLTSDVAVPPEDLERIKSAYNEVVARLVGDIQLTDARTNYATAQVVLNA
jgi:hypothetical protein